MLPQVSGMGMVGVSRGRGDAYWGQGREGGQFLGDGRGQLLKIGKI